MPVNVTCCGQARSNRVKSQELRCFVNKVHISEYLYGSCLAILCCNQLGLILGAVSFLSTSLYFVVAAATGRRTSPTFRFHLASSRRRVAFRFRETRGSTRSPSLKASVESSKKILSIFASRARRPELLTTLPDQNVFSISVQGRVQWVLSGHQFVLTTWAISNIFLLTVQRLKHPPFQLEVFAHTIVIYESQPALTKVLLLSTEHQASYASLIGDLLLGDAVISIAICIFHNLIVDFKYIIFRLANLWHCTQKSN